MFKRIKREGFQWHRTRMEDPRRVERHWLVLALAMVRLVTAAPETNQTAEAETDLAAAGLVPSPRGKRLTWVFRAGWIALIVAPIKRCPLPEPAFYPEPWPSTHKKKRPATPPRTAHTQPKRTAA